MGCIRTHPYASSKPCRIHCISALGIAEIHKAIMNSNFLAYAAGLLLLAIVYLFIKSTGKKAGQISFHLVEQICVAIIALAALILILLS